MIQALWFVFVAAFTIVGLGPLVLALRFAPTWWLALFAIPLGLLTGVLALLLIAFVVVAILPKPKPGRYVRGRDSEALAWLIYAGAAGFYLKVFQPLLFQNDLMRFLVLRALHCDAAYSSWITTRAHLGDPWHVRIGAGAVIGEHAMLIPVFQPRPGKLVIGDIEIGARTLISGLAVIASSTRIGADCIVQMKVEIGPGVTIGDGAQIGAATRIDAHATIGRNVRMGRDCRIGPRARIPDGAILPDGTNQRR